MNKAESKSLSGPIKLLQEAWSEYKANAVTFALILITPAILELFVKQHIAFFVLEKMLGRDMPSSLSPIIPFSPVIFIVLLLVYITILSWSNTALYLSIVEKYSDWRISYHKGINKIIPFFLINLLIALLVSGGLALFIIPGIILYVWLFLAPFVYFEENKGVFKALAKSKEYVKGYWWPVFLRGLFILFVSIVVTVVFGIITEALRMPLVQNFVSIALTPITILYSFELYRELKAIHSKD